ncbi:16S rRNA (cytosine(1402)-N(4))-methyltransferase RsmH [Pontibaca methylaminivorans]|uniref:Ribosomal RNA small subunit methyltransferase H n=1 Tax=Pontibaca methylaminivorans TaxID=515897 RepID=A0A1R3WGW7_9RHOB|nr:16S rRNA (cytosine(1402)-N(4))-methyltransferase RsmH [Pontibaca methylaminivorans]SIT77187.1 16S rRNA (cytosine1402-N4)-methyltransferase [Pontibaca methylaminivorans]
MVPAPTPPAPAPVPHVPVLLRPLMKAAAPVTGVWLDGTFGAGGYTRALLDAGAEQVIALDRDPMVFEMARAWAGDYGERLVLRQGLFSQMDEHVAEDVGLDGVVLDLGVSSMQLDQSERGFSFMREGPLDMRMSGEGPDAADLVNRASEAELADILYFYGEERAARRIARAIVTARSDAPLETTLQLAAVVESCLPRARPGQARPATRSFQALRIAVNREYEELFQGLMAAERVLKPGGVLAVVTFHSLEDRMVKRFFALRAGQGGGGSRHAPEEQAEPAGFTLDPRKAIKPDAAELAENPRARSARLRIARRTDAPARPVDPRAIAMPPVLRPAERGGR